MAKILVVDDEDMILDLFALQLGKEGHEVFLARNSNEAIAIIERSRPELAIVDLVMPGKGGLTLIMEHLALEPHLAVIAMSGRLPMDTDAMLGLGPTLRISAFLPKPFTPDEVRAVIATALAKR